MLKSQYSIKMVMGSLNSLLPQQIPLLPFLFHLFTFHPVVKRFNPVPKSSGVDTTH